MVDGWLVRVDFTFENQIDNIIRTMWIGVGTLVAKHPFAILCIFTKMFSHSHLLLNVGGEIRHAMLMEKMRIVVL